MCQVKFKACYYCHKLAVAHLTHCPPAARHLNASEPSQWRIFSSFSWSPFDGCSGLEVDSCIAYPSLPGRQSACQNCTVRSVQILERAGRRWRGEDEMEVNDDDDEELLIDERPIDEEEQTLRADEALRNVQLHTRWGESGMLQEQLPELFTRQTLNSPSPTRWERTADSEEEDAPAPPPLGVLSPSDSDDEADRENRPNPLPMTGAPWWMRSTPVSSGADEPSLRRTRPVVPIFRSSSGRRPSSSRGPLEPIEEEVRLRTPTRREFWATESRILGSPSSSGLL